MFSSLFEKFAALLGFKKDENPPTPSDKPTKRQPTLADYLKAWQLLKEIPFQKLVGVLSASAVVLFFAASGVAAWLFLLIKLFATSAH